MLREVEVYFRDQVRGRPERIVMVRMRCKCVSLSELERGALVYQDRARRTCPAFRITRLRAVLLTTAMAGTLAGQASPVMAGEGRDTSRRAQLAQAAPVGIVFAIAPGPLPAALAAFGDRAGLQVLYPAELARGIASAGATGTMAPEAALDRLLQGTGLTYRFTSATTVTLARIAAAPGAVLLPPMTVEGVAASGSAAMIGNLPPAYSGGQVARGAQVGLLGNRDVMDTPFNQTSYTAQVIEDQQARSLGDVMGNDPSVRLNHPRAGHAEQFSIRGFSTGNHDIAFGGLFGVAPAFSVGMAMAERVEVLKGPNALLTGMAPTGSVGGTINIVPKRAEDAPLTRLTTGYVSDSQLGAHVDLGRRFGAEKEFGLRFNGVYRDGDTAGDDQTRQEEAAVAGLDYRGDRFRLSADLIHQARHLDAPSLPTYFGGGFQIPSAPDNRTNWFQPWSWTEVQDRVGVLRGEVDLASDWTAFAAVGGRESFYQTLIAYPTVFNSAGAFNTNPVQYDYKYVTDTEELGVRGRLSTGPIDHRLTISGTRFHQDVASAFANPSAPITSNIYNPVTAPRPAIGSLTRRKSNETETRSLAFADVLSIWDERVQLIAGVRQQEVEARNFSVATGAMTSRYEESAVTPAVGFVVKPWQFVSFYGNYIEGLQQGTVVGPTYANAGQVLPPYVSKQREIGVKVDWGNATTTLSAFEITQPSGTASSLSGVFSADGEKRNRGLEFNAFGQVADDIRILGGAMLIDGTLTKTANGAFNGKTAPGVPEMRLNLGGEWDTPFIRGLTLSGRVIHTSSQYVDNANLQSIGSWTRFDLGARYRLETAGTPITIRFNVDNVFDKSYWENSDGFSASAAAPRTFLLSTTFDF